MKDEEKRVIEDESGATDVAPKADEEVTQSAPEPEAEDAPMADESAPKAEPNAEPIEDAPEAEETQDQPMEKMLTQSQVNELVGRARQEGRDSVMRELYGRYGVSNDEEMNDVFGRGQAYMGLDDEYNAAKASMKMLMAENALLKSKVDANRWDDVKAILGTKGYDITPENIESEIVTHPEWRSGYIGATPTVESADVAAAPQAQAPQQAAEPTVLRRLGSEATVSNPDDSGETEEDKVKKLFGM